VITITLFIDFEGLNTHNYLKVLNKLAGERAGDQRKIPIDKSQISNKYQISMNQNTNV
jgi:hypothetical protein